LCPRITRRLTALRQTPRERIDDNNNGVSAGFGGHGNQCPGRERLFHRGNHPSAIPGPCRIRSNAGVLNIGDVRGGAHNSSGFVRTGAIYKQATPALLLLGALAGAMQLLDAGIGLFEHDLGKCGGPLFIAVLQFFVVYLLHRSVRIAPQTKRG
jgi:hypothetical protein